MTTLNTTTLASNQVTLSSVQLNQVIEQLKTSGDLVATYNDYACNNGYEHIMTNDEYNIDTCFNSPYDAIQAAQYGDYNANHEYYILNGSANLVSFNYPTDDNSPIDIEELAQWIVDNELFDVYDIEVTTLDDMLASIEDNITDDENLLKTAINYLGVSTMYKGDDKMTDYNQYLIDSVMEEIKYTDYETIKGVIDRLGINYE